MPCVCVDVDSLMATCFLSDRMYDFCLNVEDNARVSIGVCSVVTEVCEC